MKLLGANAAPRVSGQEALPGKAHYLRGRDPRRWVTNVPTYAKVCYTDVYRGVDLLYYGNQRQLEYDFVVRPGADPRRIRLGFAGARQLRIDPSGDLLAETAGGTVRWRRPVVYQEVNGTRREIAARYILLPNAQRLTPNAHRLTPPSVGFRIAAYDPHCPLVIDPVLLLSATYLGGTGVEGATGIALDASGNAYVTGNTAASFTQQSEAFVAKLNPAGSAVLYTTVFGGRGFDTGTGIAIDALGRAVVSGQTASADFPTTPGAFQRDTDGVGQDAFVTKLNASGTGFVFSTLLSVLGDDGASGIALDAAGNAYLSGLAFPGDFLDVDGFIARFDPTGSTLLYLVRLGDAADDVATAIAVDGSGSAYATGLSQNPDFLDYDVFMVKLDPAGSAFRYTLLLGGIDDESGEDIAVDAAGNASVTGWTASTDFPIANALQRLHRGGLDTFVCKVNAAGTAFVFSTFLGGSGTDVGSGIAHDAAGNVYVTGTTDSDDFPTANPWPGSARGGLTDAFVTKLSANGSRLIFSGYLGGGGDDGAAGIAVDAAGGAYVSGQTYSTDFPRVKPVNAALGGELDAFVAKVGDGTAPLTSIAAAPAPNANGWSNASVTVTLTAADEADGSGVKEIVYALSGAQTASATVTGGRVPVTVTAEGSTLLTYFARDAAGNEEATKTLTVRIDRTAPVVTTSRSPGANAQGWNNTPVTATFTARDALSGINGADTVNVVMNAEGANQSASRTFTDQAGNSATATVAGINIDLTAPTVTFGAPSPAPNAAGWHNVDVSLAFTVADALSGVASSNPAAGPLLFTTEGAALTRTVTAIDVAGNVATVTSPPLKIDKTPPVITAARSPAAPFNGWSNSDVTVSFACSDPLSGVAVCPPATVLSREGILQSAAGTAIDVAGNVASATLGGIRIDKTPPIITYTGGGEYTVDQQVVITCSAVDAAPEFPSGLAFSSCQNVNAPAYTFGLGPHELVSLASDRAGNLGTGSTVFNVKVTFTSLCNLTSRFATNAGVAAALCANLTAAEAAAGRGDTRAKAAALATYTAAVTAESGRSIPADRAGVLTSLAGGL